MKGSDDRQQIGTGDHEVMQHPTEKLSRLQYCCTSVSPCGAVQDGRIETAAAGSSPWQRYVSETAGPRLMCAKPQTMGAPTDAGELRSRGHVATTCRKGVTDDALRNWHRQPGEDAFTCACQHHDCTVLSFAVRSCRIKRAFSADDCQV